MGRWEPDARSRLERAAMELFGERGYDATTVAGIAERAGLTQRTFFRHFTDKREVLFSGAAALQEFLVRGVEEAPASMSPLDTIAGALDAVGPWFDERAEFARARQVVIAGSPELRERELIKLAALAGALAAALRRRGVGEPAASLAAELGMAVFRIGFERWAGGESGQPLSGVIREALDELTVVAGGRATRS